MHSNGKTKQLHAEFHDENTGEKNEHEKKSNNAQIAIPQNYALDAVLDTVLTAWTILIQRYQRDTFHQFTWSIQGNDDDAQCMPTAELEFPRQKTAEDLRRKLSSLRPAGCALTQGSSIIMNDGTNAEVCPGGG
jgi:hypothetical protein